MDSTATLDSCFLTLMADDLYNLELLSLVAKITQEIANHTGHNEKSLAEFVIHIHDQSNKSLPAFKAKLKEVGAEFSDSFVENVDRLILSLHPKHKSSNRISASNPNGEASGSGLSEEEKRRRLFPGLAIKNNDPNPSQDPDIFIQDISDMVNAKKPRARPAEEDEPSRKRQRRTPSPRRRSLTPPRGRNDRYGQRSRQPDEKPIIYKIYNGKVSGLKEFGAFVTLEGVAGRAEGAFLAPQMKQHLN